MLAAWNSPLVFLVQRDFCPSSSKSLHFSTNSPHFSSSFLCFFSCFPGLFFRALGGFPCLFRSYLCYFFRFFRSLICWSLLVLILLTKVSLTTNVAARRWSSELLQFLHDTGHSNSCAIVSGINKFTVCKLTLSSQELNETMWFF